MATKLNFTKDSVARLSAKAERYAVYDSKTPGLCVQVTPNGVKTFYLIRKVGGKTTRVKIGSFPSWTVDQARKSALDWHAKMNEGKTPKALKQAEISLQAAFQTYIEARGNLKASTRKDYAGLMRTCFAEWQDKPLGSIDSAMVAEHHNRLTQDHGKVRANMAMRLLSSLCNFATYRYPEALQANPTRVLTHTKAWHRIERRTRLIRVSELPAWWDAVHRLDPLGRDYFVVALLTGLRREELFKLAWADVDFAAMTITARDTKNHSDHTLPLSDYLRDLLRSRRNTEPTATFVFTSRRGNKAGNPFYWASKVTEATGIEFSSHDLRRSFATILESLDVSAYSLKRLLNHKSGISDVTAGYVIHDIERLRPAMQKVTDFVLRVVGAKPTAAVVPLRRESETA